MERPEGAKCARSARQARFVLAVVAAGAVTTVKSMDLSQYRIVYFATHGLVGVGCAYA